MWQNCCTFFLCIFFVLFRFEANAQHYSNYRQQQITITSDTVTFDTLSIAPESIEVKNNQGEIIPKTDFYLNAEDAKIWFPQNYNGQKIVLAYRTFPFLFSNKYANKNNEAYQQQSIDVGYVINSSSNYNTSNGGQFVDFGNLNYNGNISRGIGFGNSQSLNVNSSFNLQLFGMITDDIEIKAAITDNNIPIQPEGNTAQLQEFDQVYIQLRKDDHYLTVGDFDLKKTNNYFMKYQRNLQGVSYQGMQEISDVGTVSAGGSFAVSRGKFVINNFQGQEGNQGPYRLKGPNNETYIIVLAGSERVFINGELQQRGDNNQYVIDYNTGTVTFTPNKLITQDLRIRVEFEYADRYYFRSLYNVNGGFEQEKFKVDINFFSQQDAKNQPINQDLNDERIQILEQAGDAALNAYINSAIQVDFDANRVLYEQKDTLIAGVIDTFYQYSSNSAATLYALSFALVGEGLGSYEPQSSVANGRVFAYVGPNLGSYAPIVRIVAPQKQQQLDSRFTYKMNKLGKAGVEFSLSNLDKNTFSEIDNGDNLGYGLYGFIDQNFQLKKDSAKFIHVQANYEFKEKNFTPLERYRAVEFNRNFSIDKDTLSHEHLAFFQVAYNNGKGSTVQYAANIFNQKGFYSGAENVLQSHFKKRGWQNTNNVRVVLAKTNIEQIQFIRPKIELSKNLNKSNTWILGVNTQNEINRVKNITNDSLNSRSFMWQDYGMYIQTADSLKNQFKLSYNLHYQHISKGTSFDKPYMKAHTIALSGRVISKKKHTVNWILNYRNLQQDTLFSADNELQHFYLGRIDYSKVAFKGAIKNNTLYELGAGREQKIQYSYVQDPNGQGNYAWNDINENGVQEIDEFYISNFQNENKYIKFYTYSTEYLPVNNTRFNESIQLNPKAVWYNAKGIKSFIARFSSSTALQFSKKVYATQQTGIRGILSPFSTTLSDSLLVNTQTSIRNIIFFNRTDTKFGADYTYNYNSSKTLLTSGFERRKLIMNTFNVRWNFYKNTTFTSFYGTGFKQNGSDFFKDRVYEYIINETGGGITWLYKNQLRLEGTYKYSFRSNPMAVTGGQFCVSNEAGATIKYAKANNYSISSQFTYTSVGYNDDSYKNEQLQFDMLQGLQAGNNFVWNVGIDKTFAKLLQVSAQYDGRKIGDAKSLHGGRVQVRAIF